MARTREGTMILGLGGLGVALLIFLYNLARVMRGDMTYQPQAGPLVALGIGACAAYGALVLGPVGRAIARRLLGPDEESRDQLLEDVRSALLGVQAELSETHERLDFAERMLAQSRTPDQLPRR